MAALLVSTSADGGQTSASTGAIAGTVTEATGGVLGGVTVAVSGEAIMGTRTAVTNSEGRYRVPALPPGEFNVSFALNGFRRVERQGIRIGIGFTAAVDIEMTVATEPERVTVRAAAAVLDRSSAATIRTFDAEELAALPNSRSILALLGTAPGMEVSRMEVGGGTGTGGGAYGAYGPRGGNRPALEGVVLTGIFPTVFTLDYGSFEEAAVLTAAHGPEWPQPGAHMQIVTKSGGNTYRGGLYADYENRHWQSFNVDDDQVRRGAQSGGGLSPREANRLWHFSDLNADLGGFVVRDKLWWYGSARRQDVSTRLVNFPVRPQSTRITNQTGKITYGLSAQHRLTGFLQAGTTIQPHALQPFGPEGSRINAASALSTSDDSTAQRRVLGWVGKAEWNAVVGDRLLFELRAAEFGADHRTKPRSSTPRVEDISTLVVRGGDRESLEQLRRDQIFGATDYFMGGPRGEHQLKAGVEAIRSLDTTSWLSGYPGNVVHVTRGGSPTEVYLFETPTRSANGMWSYAGYGSYSWRPHRRVTVDAGVRIDRYRLFLPGQEHPWGDPAAQVFAPVPDLAVWNVAVPRLGTVFDLHGRATTLLKATYAQYRAGVNTPVAATANPNPPEWWRRYAWADSNADGLWQRGEEYRELGRRGGATTESIDPSLRLSAMHEVTGWLERELPGRVAVRTGVVWRGERDVRQRQNTRQPWSVFTVPVAIPDPGVDGILNTGDDAPALSGYDIDPGAAEQPPEYVLRNVPGASTSYWTWEASAIRRLQDRWSLAAAFTHTWWSDHASGYSGQAIRNNMYPLTPNDLMNTASGGRHEFTTWTFKAHATFIAPRRVRVTPMLRHQSGQPFGRTFATSMTYGIVRILAEPVGTRRMDHLTVVDLRVEKGFKVRRPRRIAGFADLFNALNGNAEQNIVWSAGPSFLRPVTILPPRVLRIGLKVDW